MSNASLPLLLEFVHGVLFKWIKMSGEPLRVLSLSLLPLSLFLVTTSLMRNSYAVEISRGWGSNLHRVVDEIDSDVVGKVSPHRLPNREDLIRNRLNSLLTANHNTHHGRVAWGLT